MTTDVLFEDQEIRVLFQSGTSDFLFVTFGDLAMLAKPGETRFYADVPAGKRRFNALGFMAKTENWFPSQSVQAAMGSVQPALRNFSQRVLYGGSWGDMQHLNIQSY